MCRLLLFLWLLNLPLLSQNFDLVAPHANFDFVDQKNGPGNSCGPASLLNAFGSGSPRWQAVYAQVPGTIDQGRLNSVIKIWAFKPSGHLPDRRRWQDRGGINLNDLADIAEEMRAPYRLPQLRAELLFSSDYRTRADLLRATHQKLARSLKKGFPPVLSVRRFVLRDGQWQGIQGHFVTLIAMPKRLAHGANDFTFRYVDPVGARVLDATLGTLDTNPSAPCLMMNAPQTTVGKHLVKRQEATHLGLTALIGSY